MPTIVAVAIGKAYRQATIDDPTNIPTWARRYINGFVTSFPHALGTAYTIDYRECPKADLNNKVFTNQLQADYVLCLSTTVLTYAAQFYPAASNKPIVGICSHPEEEPFSGQGNVCGVSPARSDDAKDAYRNLLNTVSPQLPQATVLHDPSYRPSRDGLNKIHLGGDRPPVVPVSTPADVQNWIATQPRGSGALLLPVDWMFGSAPDIIGSASNRGVLDFWLVTDWVVPAPAASAFGGYGVPQETSGQYLAQQLDVIWHGGWPAQPWLPVKQADRAWKASQTRATSAGVRLNTINGPVIVP